MKNLIKKYAILLIIGIVLSHLITAIILTIWPNLLTTEYPDGHTLKLGSDYLTVAFEYSINIVFIILIAKDMKRENLKSIPILILTFFYSLLGVIFFLVIIATKKINLIKTNSYE
ncbi:MAG: hypothetical protein KAT68_08705 [Bacteroidales bacterium]|nr:hypothetical protein [Bacteroidales bacterium]